VVHVNDAEWNGQPVTKIIVWCLDPFGKRWHIIAKGENFEAVLYSWRCDFTTLVPLKRGWEALPCPLIDYLFYARRTPGPFSAVAEIAKTNIAATVLLLLER